MNDRQAHAQHMANVYAQVTGSVRATYTIEERLADGTLRVLATATSNGRTPTMANDQDAQRDTARELAAEQHANSVVRSGQRGDGCR
jgi:hypothetical protein